MCGSERLYAKFPTIITNEGQLDVTDLLMGAQQEQLEDWQQPSHPEQDKETVTIETWVVIDMNLVDSFHPTFYESDELKYTFVTLSTGGEHLLNIPADKFEEKLIEMIGYSYGEEDDTEA